MSDKAYAPQSVAPLRPGLILELAQAAQILHDIGYLDAAEEVVMTIRWLNKPHIVRMPTRAEAELMAKTRSLIGEDP